MSHGAWHASVRVLVTLAYCSVAVLLLYVTVMRRDLPRNKIVVLFVAGFLVSLATHLIDDFSLGYIDGWLFASVKAVTVGASLFTFAAMLRLVPDALHFPSHTEVSRLHTDMDRAQALAHFGTWTCDVGSDTVHWSPELGRIFGLTQEAVPKTFAEYLERVHPEDRNRVETAFRTAYENGTSYSVEERIIRPGGERRFLSTVGEAVVDDHGKVNMMAGVCHDQTDAHRGDALFRDLLEAAPDAIVVADPAGRIVLVNQQSERLFGYGRGELIGQPMEMLVPERLGAGHINHRAQYGSESRPRPMGTALGLSAKRKDGTEFEVESSLAPLNAEKGLLLMSTIRDVSDRNRAERALRESAKQLEAAQRLGRIGSWVWDVGTNSVVWSDQLYRICDQPIEAGALVFEKLFERIQPDDRKPIRKALARARRRAEGWTLQIRLVQPDGGIRVLKTEGFPVAEGRRVLRVIGTVQDVTDQVRAGEGRRASDERFRRAFEEGPLGMVIFGRDAGILQVNRSCCEMMDCARGELVGAPFLNIMHPDDRSYHSSQVTRLLKGEIVRCQFETRFIRKNGAVEWALLAMTIVRDAEDRPDHGLAMIDRITGRKRAEAEVDRLIEERRHREIRLENISRRLVRVQEEDRRAFARELHDEIGQVLTTAKLSLEMDPANSRERIREVRRLLDDLLARVRNLSLTLRPPMLDDLGLLPTILWLVERMNAGAGMHVTFTHSGLDRRFGPDIETAAYRIVQESLTNVARHAGAAEARVFLFGDNEELSMTVQDSGVGFELDAGSANGSSGLLNMRERAALLGGELTIESGPGRGTRVSASLPLGVSDGAPQ